MRLELRQDVSWLRRALAPALAVAAAFILCAIPLHLSGANVVSAYGLIIEGSLGSTFALSETLTRTTPLILTGLAATVAFRAKLWNIGAEGQLYMGALAAVAIGTGAITASPVIMLPLIILSGALAGGLFMLGPAWLKTRLGVDEVVTTLLLNFVVLLFVGMMLEGPLQDPMSLGWPQSAPIIDAAALPQLVAKTRLHFGLIIAVAACILLWILIQKTVTGFEIRAVGDNPAAASYAGMGARNVMLKVALISGGLAGLAGVGEVAGLKGYLTQDLSPGFGYAGIVVAMLAQLNALAVMVAAFFIAAVFVGADAMSRAIGISNYIADLIVATSLLTMLIANLFVRFRLRWGRT